MDTGFVAGLDSVCWHAAFLLPAFALARRAGVRRIFISLSLRLEQWDITCRDDPCLWRSRFVRAFQMALYSRAAVPSRVCTAFFWWDLKGILLAFSSGRLARIDANLWILPHLRRQSGTFDALTRRLDFAMCVIWFATAVALSPYRLSDTLDTYYMCGGPFIRLSRSSRPTTVPFRRITVSILFLLHFGRMWIIGKRPNPVKVALLVTSIAFWCIAIISSQIFLSALRCSKSSTTCNTLPCLDLQPQSRGEG